MSLKNPVHIGIDLMGGDTPPALFLRDLIPFAKKMENRAKFTVFATPDVLTEAGDISPLIPFRVETFIQMDEHPLLSIKKKRGASIPVAIHALKNKKIDALVSPGNTGALFAAAYLSLSKLPGVSRPALLLRIPTLGRPMAVLDVGANVSWKPKHLLQYASIGIAFQKSLGVESPQVGLLNVGTESLKGSPDLQEVHEKLLGLNSPEKTVFIGNVEGKGAFLGNIDVLVTDGFTGNIFLKTSEGVAHFILQELENRFTTTPEPLGILKKHLHTDSHPGALLAGVNGIVIKCHGDSTSRALLKSAEEAITLCEGNFLQQITNQLSLDQKRVK